MENHNIRLYINIRLKNGMKASDVYQELKPAEIMTVNIPKD